jgi:hypothetical protein
MSCDPNRHAEIVLSMRRWLEAAVIGLGLCPFARNVANAGLIRYRVSDARSAAALRSDLVDELRLLAQADPAGVETTLLIHPWALQDFLAFNDFLGETGPIVEELGLDGTLQVASFHPRYQFAGTKADDVENCTNRAPFPTLHLLREASIERVLATFPDPSSIYERNVATLRRIGRAGWAKVQEEFAPREVGTSPTRSK